MPIFSETETSDEPGSLCYLRLFEKVANNGVDEKFTNTFSQKFGEHFATKEECQELSSEVTVFWDVCIREIGFWVMMVIILFMFIFLIICSLLACCCSGMGMISNLIIIAYAIWAAFYSYNCVKNRWNHLKTTLSKAIPSMFTSFNETVKDTC